MMSVPARGVVIGNDNVRTQLAKFQHHPFQRFTAIPESKCFFHRLRKTEILETEEVGFRTLYLRCLQRFLITDYTEFFVEFGANRILSALAVSGEKTDCVRAVFPSQNC